MKVPADQSDKAEETVIWDSMMQVTDRSISLRREGQTFDSQGRGYSCATVSLDDQSFHSSETEGRTRNKT